MRILLPTRAVMTPAYMVSPTAWVQLVCRYRNPEDATQSSCSANANTACSIPKLSFSIHISYNVMFPQPKSPSSDGIACSSRLCFTSFLFESVFNSALLLAFSPFIYSNSYIQLAASVFPVNIMRFSILALSLAAIAGAQAQVRSIGRVATDLRAYTALYSLQSSHLAELPVPQQSQMSPSPDRTQPWPRARRAHL